jgi:hypothetical protein
MGCAQKMARLLIKLRDPRLVSRACEALKVAEEAAYKSIGML